MKSNDYYVKYCRDIFFFAGGNDCVPNMEHIFKYTKFKDNDDVCGGS